VTGRIESGMDKEQTTRMAPARGTTTNQTVPKAANEKRGPTLVEAVSLQASASSIRQGAGALTSPRFALRASRRTR
jgi:hypothetical protein